MNGKRMWLGCCVVVLMLVCTVSAQVDFDTEDSGDSLVIQLGDNDDSSSVSFRDSDGDDALVVTDQGATEISGNLDMDGNDVLAVGSITVEDDITVQDYIEHRGDLDTYINFNTNQIDIFCGGVNVLALSVSL